MTTKSCAVPTCNTGRKSIKEKLVMFKVPSNIELRKKWIAAIPEIFDLQPSQFVCEKHFLEEFIRRKWTKCDTNGRVIMEAPYSHVRLNPLAVPSKFDDSSDLQNVHNAANRSNESSIRAEHSYSSLKPPMTETLQTPTPMAIDNLSSSKNPRTTMGTIVHESTKSIHNGLIRDQCIPETRGCTFDFADVGFSCTIEEKTYSILIPKPWTVGKLNTDSGSVFFSCTTSKVENGENIPILERFVKLASNRQLRYFVYGRLVDVRECDLPRVLDTTVLLPQALRKFKNMNLCIGVGSINDHLSLNSVYRDGVERWRDTYCTLISKSKKCVYCMKRRAVMLKKKSRTESRKLSKRICQASNPMDQKKMSALRKKK